MNTIFKTLAVVGALTAGGVALSQGAMADSDDNTSRAPAYGYNCQQDGRGMGPGKGMGPAGGGHRGMHGQGGFLGGRFDPNRSLSVEQVRILTQAHLIRMGNDNLKIGKIAETKNKSYEVQIVTKDNSLVNVVEISKVTGMPVR